MKETGANHLEDYQRRRKELIMNREGTHPGGSRHYTLPPQTGIARRKKREEVTGTRTQGEMIMKGIGATTNAPYEMPGGSNIAAYAVNAQYRACGMPPRFTVIQACLTRLARGTGRGPTRASARAAPGSFSDTFHGGIQQLSRLHRFFAMGGIPDRAVHLLPCPSGCLRGRQGNAQLHAWKRLHASACASA